MVPFRAALGRVTTMVFDGARGTIAAVPPQPSTVRLVLGDEELLATRAVGEVVAAARAEDPDAEVREYAAGDLVPGEFAEMTSPSLFGGRRVLVVRAVRMPARTSWPCWSSTRRIPTRT